MGHSRNNQFRAECAGKARYPSPEHARRTLHKYRDQPDAADLHPYRCSFCHRWHIGHANPLRQQRRRPTPAFWGEDEDDA